ncbi:AAA family ATPase [Pseudoalteromonas luteoviolacea]|uniref:Chromosome partitioning protein ParA n=1 Tax=Pseudoalteromonas luteoviolacea S4060-1 TaxID=1365257 RepID=A0A167MED2_9GAMM|nr:AAA family ATPase [Pseudoalteromonas luteoviolacea]KZN66255.1 chromosome partitioning protein ParA [Pseudoalteromonas luteoviolacea S4060-1]
MTNNAIEQLDDLISISEEFIRLTHTESHKPEEFKKLRLFSTAETEKMVNKSRTTIQRAENDGVISAPAREPNSNHRVGYSLEQINTLRDHFSTLPGREEGDEALVLAIANFKGGCAKTTSTVNLSQYLALEGYKVLVVDMDSQATLTSMFGFIPDMDFNADNTVLPYFNGEKDALDYAVHTTHIPNVHIIPACLELYHAELGAASHISEMTSVEERIDFFKTLRYGIDSIRDNYDVILVDSPPSLGIISVNVLLAADALLVPCACKMYDFSSTTQFFRMVKDYISKLDPDKAYKFIKVVASQYDRREHNQKDFLEVLKGSFGDRMLTTPFLSSSEIAKSAARFETPYEQSKPNRRIIDNMALAFKEVELEILKTWPSKEDKLIELGVLI